MLHRVLIVIVLLGVSWPAAARQPSLEYDVRAAFVLNFARYVEWPSARQKPPLSLCVLQHNPFGDRLAEVVAGERWREGGITVQTVPDVRSSATCHLLYVPATATARFRAGSSLLAKQPVLTVGEHEQFLSDGGIIRLFVEENHVRFSINQRVASAAGLQISSRLLRLARSVIGTS